MSSSEPQHIGDVLSKLMARRGYARMRSGDACGQAWRQAAGEAWAAGSCATQARRGVLEVWVSNSTLLQEIGFAKAALIARLAELVPDEKIRDLKLRIGRMN